MRVHMVDEYCQRLCKQTGLSRAGSALPCTIEHDPGAAEIHLGAIGRLAITVVLGKAERRAQPRDGSGDVLISDVRQYCVRRNRAISQHGFSIQAVEWRCS